MAANRHGSVFNGGFEAKVMTKKPKRKVGRPSGYKPEYAELARRVCEVFGKQKTGQAGPLNGLLGNLAAVESASSCKLFF
jgi:hypothetical protein